MPSPLLATDSTATPAPSSVSAAPPPPSLTAVICGAHTTLGALVLRDLLRSPSVAHIHALAPVDPRSSISPSSRPLARTPVLHLHIDDLYYADRTVFEHVPRADVAFVTLGSSRDDLAAQGPLLFHADNFDVPRRFLRAIFDRVPRIEVLSADGAHSHVRGSEFLRVKGELVDAIVRMQCEMGKAAPAVALFRVPLLLTNKMSLHGDEASAPLINRVKQHAVLKFERGPAQAVHVRDVAKAMVADGINNAKKVELSDIEFRFRKRQYDLIEYWGEDIVWMATERRDAQKRAWRRRKEEREGKRVSEYAKVEGGVQSEWSEGSASVQGGGGGDVVDGYAQGVPYEQDMPGESERSGDSSEGGSTDVGIDRLSQQWLGNPPDVKARAAVRNAGSLPIGSVESLAHQLAQPPVKIRDNELLPDVELSEASRRESSVEKVAPALYDTTNWEQEVLEQEREAHREYGDEGNVLEDLALYSTASGEDVDGLPPPEGIQLPDYAPLTGGMAGEDRFSDESFDPTQDFPERDSYVSYASYAAGRVPEEEIISRYRPDLQPDEAQLEATFEEDPRNNRRFRQSTRAEDMPSRRRRKESVRSQNQVDSAAPMQRFSALVSRIIAATDRPSQRRQRRARVVEVEDTELDMLDQGFDGFYDPPLRGNGDMREAGNVDI